MTAVMEQELSEAVSAVEEAAGILFDVDPSVRSVGVGRYRGRPSFVAVRNSAAIVPLSGRLGVDSAPSKLLGFSVHYLDSFNDPVSELRLPHSGPGSPGTVSLVPEQFFHRPLVCGLQVQNFDDDVRSGAIEQGHIVIGTLGCFASTSGGKVAMLSNNHVLAAENSGKRGKDRILQPGSATFIAAQHAARLSDFVALKPSPPGAQPRFGTAIFNEVDAAIATLMPNLPFAQAYLPARSAKPPIDTAAPAYGDRVHKVGRTTGLTHGVIVKTSTIVGPVGYRIGPCWFSSSFAIVGTSGTMFSDSGDSGSAIVRSSDGAVLGLLYAGNGTQTYACPIDLVLSKLKCSLWQP